MILHKIFIILITQLIEEFSYDMEIYKFIHTIQHVSLLYQANNLSIGFFVLFFVKVGKSLKFSI